MSDDLHVLAEEIRAAIVGRQTFAAISDRLLDEALLDGALAQAERHALHDGVWCNECGGAPDDPDRGHPDAEQARATVELLHRRWVR